MASASKSIRSGFLVKTIFGTALFLFTILSFPARALERIPTLFLFAPGFYSNGQPFKVMRADISGQVYKANVKVQRQTYRVKFDTANSLDLAELDGIDPADPCASVEKMPEVRRLRELHKAQLTLLMVDKKLFRSPVQLCGPTLVLVDSSSYGTDALSEFLEQLIKTN